MDYCFSKSLSIAPFRHLLKPSTKFEWTDELGECFEESKKKIIGLIEDGVRSFDPQLVTCLTGARMGLVGFCSRKFVLVMQSALYVVQMVGGWYWHV